MRLMALIIICFGIISCTSLPEPIPETVSDQLQHYPTSVQNCAFQLVDFKRAVQQQGVQDAQLLWTPRYPHHAFDRFSVSLIPGLISPQSKKQWLRYVARQAEIQRKVEFQNLPNKAGFQLGSNEECAQQLTASTINDRQFWLHLQQRPPTIPSDYQSWQRVFGLYPISKSLATPSIDSEKKRIINGFIQPLHDDNVTYAVTEKSPLNQQEIHRWFQQATQLTPLSWPLLSDKQIARLANHYAPEFLIETVSLDDKPGQLEYQRNGQPRVNTNKPTLYVSQGYTQFHGKILLQLNYSLWFANRTAKASLDPYAGQFDGILVRLTLDSQGKPYILDSIHHCGCYHMVFALDQQLAFAKRNTNIEAPITMRLHPKQNAQTLRVTFTNGDHMVKGVHWSHSSSQARHLNVLNYQQLRSMPIQGGQYKSLFDEQGMLMASKRLERLYLWPFGVKSPGTMRQVGHHAIAFIGERHFDDAYVLSELFLKP